MSRLFSSWDRPVNVLFINDKPESEEAITLLDNARTQFITLPSPTGALFITWSEETLFSGLNGVSHLVSIQLQMRDMLHQDLPSGLKLDPAVAEQWEQERIQCVAKARNVFQTLQEHPWETVDALDINQVTDAFERIITTFDTKVNEGTVRILVEKLTHLVFPGYLAV